MHEAGIAQSILDIAIDTANKNNAKVITQIKVRVGKMAAVEEKSLRFSFDALKADTIAENAELLYEDVALIGKCVDCGEQSELEGYFVICPKCKGGVSIISGNELEIAHIEVDN